MGRLSSYLRPCLPGAVLALALMAGPVAAEGESREVALELNRLTDSDGACQAYFLISNPGQSGFDSLKLDLVALDTDGVVAKRMAVELGPIRPAKTTLKVFPVGASPCDRVGGLLLNDVIACQNDGSARDDCLSLIKTSSRTSARFFK